MIDLDAIERWAKDEIAWLSDGSPDEIERWERIPALCAELRRARESLLAYQRAECRAANGIPDDVAEEARDGK